jgi:lipopolysaccharide biosynthesis glycosyltransferase
MNNAIFIALDDRHWHYFMHCYNSILDNYPNHPKLLVHYSGWRKERISWLSYREDIRLYLKQDLPKEFSYSWYHEEVPSKMVYFKYLLWTDEYDEYDNILHLDADTIVLSPLDDLFENKEFFIVKNNISFKEVQVISNKKTYEPRLLRNNRAYRGVIDPILQAHGIKYPNQEDMVNAGIFLIPKVYRTKSYLDSLLRITNDFGPFLVYADQSALSLWCIENSITPSSDYQYNFQMPLFDKLLRSRYKENLDVGCYFNFKKDILNKIKIVHFSGTLKPDRIKFNKWGLMGRYANLFCNCYKIYSGVPY